MLASDRPTRSNANLHQLAPRLFNAQDLFRKPGIKTDQRMQVAVTGVKDVSDSQFISCGDFVSSTEHFGKTGTRNDCILDHRVGRDTSDGAKRTFARSPEFLSLSFIARVAATASAILYADARHLFCLVVETCLDAVQLDQQRRACIRW